MATTSPVVRLAVCVPDVAKALPQPRRRITPEDGRALEKLGHAIEYLMDQYFHEGCWTQTANERLSAANLLMDCQRQVYQDAPVIPPLGDRVRLWLSELVS